MTDKEKLEILIEAIDYSFLNTQGKYDKELTYPVIDKVKFIKKSMQEEPVSVDLEKAARKYAKKESHGYEPCNIVETFKAGAQWQKQQMEKKAFPVEIGRMRSDYKCMLHGNFLHYDTGDKVKVIIIKED